MTKISEKHKILLKGACSSYLRISRVAKRSIFYKDYKNSNKNPKKRY